MTYLAYIFKSKFFVRFLVYNFRKTPKHLNIWTARPEHNYRHVATNVSLGVVGLNLLPWPKSETTNWWFIFLPSQTIGLFSYCFPEKQGLKFCQRTCLMRSIFMKILGYFYIISKKKQTKKTCYSFQTLRLYKKISIVTDKREYPQNTIFRKHMLWVLADALLMST